ncbi:MAG TPA: radical SAM protein [Terriglobales bacterium]|jgi:anaerobic magnesium-protoporphyrin IX monomethyl ester cyclase|nr:radical SAM protein [Terriglobales bacterium]
MDVLLAHSFFLKNDAKQVEKMRPYPPLGTLYAASYLRSLGYTVGLFDALLSDGVHEFEALLRASDCRMVVLFEDEFHFLNKMCLNHSRQAAQAMASFAAGRGATVIACGSDVTDHPEAYLLHGVHYAILGEAEHSLGELLGTLRSTGSLCNAKLDEIPGLARADSSQPRGVRRNEARIPERHPDVFPMPAWDLLEAEPYRAAWMQAHGFFSVNMVSTRGCPFHCNWCAKPIWGQRYAMRSPANVAEEMALLKQTIRPDHIWFVDDIFGLQPKWSVQFAEEVRARDASIPFMIQSRVDLMTPDAVEALAHAGCREVWIGAESGSQKILDAMDKGICVEQIPVVRQRLKDAGIATGFFLQFGYPGETFEDILATAEMVRTTLPESIGISVSNPLPGTRFYDMVKNELGTKDHWDNSDDLAMMFQGSYRTEFYRRLYKVVHRELDVRLKLQSAPKNTTEALAELDSVNAEWKEIQKVEANYQAEHPTSVHKHYLPVLPPNLSGSWN